MIDVDEGGVFTADVESVEASRGESSVVDAWVRTRYSAHVCRCGGVVVFGVVLMTLVAEVVVEFLWLYRIE